jgi:hypothetical protein
MPLEIAHQLGGEAALAPAIGKIERPAIGHEDADHPPLRHRLEIAGPGLAVDRQGAQRRGRRPALSMRRGAGQPYRREQGRHDDADREQDPPHDLHRHPSATHRRRPPVRGHAVVGGRYKKISSAAPGLA